ncbi:MAG: hypothetical protein IPH61_07935 [Bacteroidetes bacterium]|nr:hypothetical protein [Bacteroidota bacterium]
MKNSFILVWLVLIAHTIYGQSLLELAGTWEGTGHIAVDWCSQDTLKFHFIITTDGDVNGNIGDALITSAEITQNNNIENAYLIIAKLKGSVIECEGISRSTMRIELLRNGELLEGNFQSSGKLFGKKEDGILSGANLILNYP